MKTKKNRVNLRGEKWKPVVGFEDRYLVSNKGRIWSIWNQDFKKARITEHGYADMALHRKRYRKVVKVHRLVAIAWLANPENKPEVNHRSGNKTDNRLSNLEWVTPQENVEHAKKLGLFRKKAA